MGPEQAVDDAMQRICAGSVSTHALREEGDSARLLRSCETGDFNPRPPRGGRHYAELTGMLAEKFQSTPSARRATGGNNNGGFFGNISIHALREEGDSSAHRLTHVQRTISIHALREEGDLRHSRDGGVRTYFNPRPPRGGRPQHAADGVEVVPISIHALREEGDQQTSKPKE